MSAKPTNQPAAGLKPLTAQQTSQRHRRSGAWTGDIWKLHRILQDCRPELTLLALNAHTTGLLLIAGLDPQDRVLPAVDAAQVRAGLAALQPALSAAQQADQGRAEAGIGQCQLLADQRH